jgi:predicted DNA-binding protein
MKTVTHALNYMSSVRLSHEMKARLVKIGARLSLKDGKSRSMEEIIELLLDNYEKKE